MNKITGYIKEVLGEARHVTWPTKKQTIFYTITVIVISVLVAYYLGLLDHLFAQGLNLLLRR